MLIEGEDYELIPGNEEHWHVRIKTGIHIETVISFGKITIDEKSDMIKFNFTIHFSPDGDLTVDDTNFQRYAGKILESVMVNNLDRMESK